MTTITSLLRTTCNRKDLPKYHYSISSNQVLNPGLETKQCPKPNVLESHKDQPLLSLCDVIY